MPAPSGFRNLMVLHYSYHQADDNCNVVNQSEAGAQSSGTTHWSPDNNSMAGQVQLTTGIALRHVAHTAHAQEYTWR